MRLLRKLCMGLTLRIIESKSTVDLAIRRKILRYSFWVASGSVVRCRVARKAIQAIESFNGKLRDKHLNREIFDTVLGARTRAERYR